MVSLGACARSELSSSLSHCNPTYRQSLLPSCLCCAASHSNRPSPSTWAPGQKVTNTISCAQTAYRRQAAPFLNLAGQVGISNFKLQMLLCFVNQVKDDWEGTKRAQPVKSQGLLGQLWLSLNRLPTTSFEKVSHVFVNQFNFYCHLTWGSWWGRKYCFKTFFFKKRSWSD